MAQVVSPEEFRRAAQTIEIPGMVVWNLPSCERAKALTHREQFYLGTQHTHCKARFTGGTRDPGVGYLAERMAPQGFVATNAAAAVPYSDRRPDAPNGLHRQIVTRFSDMLLGETARPNLAVPADPTTEAYIHAVMDASASWATMQQARDIKGRLGSAAIVLSVIDGQVTSEALNPIHLWVKVWAPTASWVPKFVIEQKLITKVEERDPEEKSKTIAWGGEPESRLEMKKYWATRVWTETHAITYEDVPEDWNKKDDDKDKPIPVDEMVEHKAGRCPVVWMQNTKNPESPEGDEDYIGSYEVSDKLDTARAFNCRSAIANTDPTTVVKDTPARLRKNPATSKGHGHKISVDTTGDVKLLETSGEPVRTSMELCGKLRHDVLQTAGAVILDPETMGTYKSAESIRLIMKPMEARAGRYRVPLTDEIRQVGDMWLRLGKAWGVVSVEEHDMTAIEMEGQKNHPIILPPRVQRDADGGDLQLSTHEVGKGRWIDVQWGPYLRPTPTELLAAGQALTTANGQKPLLSEETSTAVMTGFLGSGSPEDERERIAAEKEANLEEMSGLMYGEGNADPGLEAARGKAGDGKAKAEVAAAKADQTREARAKPSDSLEPKG